MIPHVMKKTLPEAKLDYLVTTRPQKLFLLALSFVKLWDLGRELCHAFITKTIYTIHLRVISILEALSPCHYKSYSSIQYSSLPIGDMSICIQKKEERERRGNKREKIARAKSSWATFQKKKRERKKQVIAMLPGRKRKETRRKRHYSFHSPPHTYLG